MVNRELKAPSELDAGEAGTVEVLRPLDPAVEYAIKLYTLGKHKTQEEAAASCNLSTNYFNKLYSSKEGQDVVKLVRETLEQRFQNLLNKAIDVIEMALDHADPAVALAGANLFMKTSKGTKVTVELSAEDVVQQIMNGSYQPKE